MGAADLGPWAPLTPSEVADLMAGVGGRWWIAGGFALEAFAGRGWREHEDIDIGVLARDQAAVREHVAEWEPFAADPPGKLRPWRMGEELREPVHDIWVRRGPRSAWAFQLMLNPGDDEALVYRRDPSIRIPWEEALITVDGVSYLAPEVQLLFKSKGRRAKDELDLAEVVPLLGRERRMWLAEMLQRTDAGHPWVGLLRSSAAEGIEG